MDGLMLHLSDELRNALIYVKPGTAVSVKGKKFCLYHGKISAKLRESGLMNIALWVDDRIFGLGIKELERSNTSIKFQERMKKLNSSEIVDLSKDNGVIQLQHWDGFRTSIDVDSMEVLSQTFTK